MTVFDSMMLDEEALNDSKTAYNYSIGESKNGLICVKDVNNLGW